MVAPRRTHRLDATGTDYDWQYTYTTRRLDEETGLMYYRNRYYDPELGQFISRDPSRHPGYDANLYRYTFNGPTMLVDPSGLQPPSAWCGGPHDIPFEPIGPGVPSVLPPGDIDFDDLGALAGRLGDELVNEIRFQVSEYCKRFGINECDCRDVNLQFSDGFQQSFVLGNGITLECTGNVCVVAGGNLGGGIHINPDPFDPTADAGIQAGAGGQVDINFGINIQVPPVNVGPGAQLQLGATIFAGGGAGGTASVGFTGGLSGTNGYTSTGTSSGYYTGGAVGACLTFDCLPLEIDFEVSTAFASGGDPAFGGGRPETTFGGGIRIKW